MDLRTYNLSPEQEKIAASLLNYQPFIISDDVQTGAAYGWSYSGDPRGSFGDDPNLSPALVFNRETCGAIWDRVSDCNSRLSRMYDDFVSEIAAHYRGGSYLDFACNNGYFPVAAFKQGMKRTKGIDAGVHYKESINFLNSVVGTAAEFEQVNYDPRIHSSDFSEKFDVVSAVAIMCHLPDPMNFLAYLGSLANEAIFFSGQVIDTDALVLAHLKPHIALGRSELPFPYRFNDNTRLSRGLLFHGFEEMGFRNIIEIPWSEEWLPPYIDMNFKPATKPDLETELKTGSKTIAVLAMR